MAVATMAALLFAIIALWFRPGTNAISANRNAASPPDLPAFEGEDSHDSFNEPVGQILIDWTKGGNVGTDEWVEIDVFVEADGRIVVSFNDKYIAEARDATLINNRYFGLMLITRENGNARVKFDYLKVD